MRGLPRIGLFAALGLFILLPLAQTFLLSFMSTLPRDGMEVGQFTLMNYATIWQTPALTASSTARSTAAASVSSPSEYRSSSAALRIVP